MYSTCTCVLLYLALNILCMQKYSEWTEIKVICHFLLHWNSPSKDIFDDYSFTTITYLPSIPPFFRAVIKLDKPFSCFQVTKTSNRKSNAKLSLTRCSLINTESTVGGTELFEIHSAVILANLMRSLGENPFMNTRTFFISSSNIFSRYLYRRMSLIKTCLFKIHLSMINFLFFSKTIKADNCKGNSWKLLSDIYLFKIPHRFHVLWLLKHTCTSLNWFVAILSDGATRNQKASGYQNVK